MASRASRPTLFLGSRGAFNFELSVALRDRAHHSGNWGGLLRNPGTVLAHAIASLVDARGRILVEALRPPPIPDPVRAALRKLDVGGGPDDPAVDDGWGEPGLTDAERLFGWNTLEVLAFLAGTPEGPQNAIPGTAMATLQLRFVVGTDWRGLVPALRRHRDGLGLAMVEVPHSYAACGQHAPNEHLLGSVAREGLALMAGLFWDLGEQGDAVRGRHRADLT